MNKGESSETDFFKADTEPSTDSRVGSKKSKSQEFGEISWTAPEFLDSKKSAGWMIIMILATVAIGGLTYLATRDWISLVVVVLMAMAFGIVANRKPKDVSYVVDANGIKVGEKQYAYEDFRSFAVFKEQDIDAIILSPAKRWMVPITIYFPANGLTAISETIGSFVPIEEHQPGYVDTFLRGIHF